MSVTDLATLVVGMKSTSTEAGLGWTRRSRVIWSDCPSCGRLKWVPIRWFGHLCNPCHVRLKAQPVGARALKPGAGAKQKGRLNHRWRGGIKTTVDGYRAVLVTESDPMVCMVDRNGYVLEHRLIVARAIGRPLLSSENVHHLNGVKDDNSEQNLELWFSHQPNGQRQSDYHCPGCRCAEVSI